MNKIEKHQLNQSIKTEEEESVSTKKSTFLDQRLKQGYSFFLKVLTPLKKFVISYLKAITIIIWMVVTLVEVITVIQPINPQDKIISLDDSWLIGLPAQLQNGAWSGRDFYFTYGPLWQVITLIGSSLSNSTSIDGSPTINLAISIVEIGLIGLSVALIRQLNARHTIILLSVIFVLNFQGAMLFARPMSTVVCILLVQRCLASPSPRNRIIWAVSGGLAFMLAQLISADLGVYTVLGAIAALLFFTLASLFKDRLHRPDLLTPRNYLTILGILVGTYLAANLLTSLVFSLTSPNYQGFFDYQIYNYEIIRGYSYTMSGTVWQLSAITTIALIATIIFVLCLIGFSFTRIAVADIYLLVCLAASALLQLKGITVRSDLGHIMLGTLPLVFLFMIIGLIGNERGWYQHFIFKAAWFALAFFLLAGWPNATLKTITQVGSVVDGSVSLSQQIQKITTGHLPTSNIIPAGLEKAIDPTKAILSFPQDNFIPIALNKPMVGPVHQAYSAFTPALQQKYVSDLERLKNTFEVVYGLDSLSAAMLENVQQVTRVPIIFEYLYRNYTLKTPQVFDGKYVLLKPRTTPTDFVATDLPFEVTKPWDGELATIRLSKPATCSMLRVTPRINYPIFSLIGRSTQLNVKVWRGGKVTQQTSMVAIEPGKSFSTYLSLIDPDKFYQIFATSQPVQTKEVDSLQFQPLSDVFLSVAPSSVDISKIECITFK
jgi:hypothetical protein